SPENLIIHPLVTYGNHGYGHHVMSALSAAQQQMDIERNAALLKRWIPPDRLSPRFALPFGRSGDANSNTLSVLKNLGYSGIAFSRGRTNLSKPGAGFDQVERWVAPVTFKEFERGLGRLKFTTHYRIAKDLVRSLFSRSTS
ncbi:MAG: polysaccharide deacetylase family protein, partial [Aestuariivirga sp.]